MTVRAILADKGAAVHTLKSDETLLAATSSLEKHSVGALVVTGEDKTILGILSERDIVRAIADDGKDALDRKVADVMTKNVKTCSQDATIPELMSMMTQGRFRHMPVAEDGKLIGIISIGDVVKKRIADVEKEADQIRDYIASS